MNKFSIRLKELMNETNPNFLAEKLGLKDENRIYAWLAGDYIPKIDTIVKLANLFECSIDYILGRTDSDEKVVNDNKIIFHERLEQIMKQKKLIKQDFRKNNILSSGLAFSIFNLKNIPYTENIIKIADYLGVSIDYLIGRI